MSFIEFDSVYKRYKMGEVVINAADGVTFNIEQGEFCIIVGASGAGKTTVLNILGGMDDCDDGKVRVAGDLVNEYDSKRLIEYRRYDVGFVFQFYNLVPNLTALENVELATTSLPTALRPKLRHKPKLRQSLLWQRCSTSAPLGADHAVNLPQPSKPSRRNMPARWHSKKSMSTRIASSPVNTASRPSLLSYISTLSDRK